MTNKILLLLFGVIILAAASQISIPFVPVPLTFQSATVVLIGMAYGWRRSIEVILCYYIAGICGLPVFANWSFGPHVFFGPSGGYLIGFLPAAAVSGYLAERGWGRSFLTSLAAAFLGVSIIFIFGLLQLATQFIGWRAAIDVGLLPFMASEPVKIIVVALLIPKLWRKPNYGHSI